MHGNSRIHGILSLLRKHSCHQNHHRVIQQLHSHLLFAQNSLHLQHWLSAWNYLIRHYAVNSPQESVFLFKYLHRKGHAWQYLWFDSFTYSFLLKAAANLTESNLGKQLHCCCCKVGLASSHVYVQTALVDMYGKCGCLVDAKKVFDKMMIRNSVTWNALFTGFVKWGDMRSAQRVFDLMPVKNIVSWTGLIDGYTRSGQFSEALSLFSRMAAEEAMKPSEVTLLAIFPAIWNIRDILYCRMVHGYGEKSGLNALDTRVMNCLIDAYAKCGSIKCAARVFEDIVDGRRSIVTWTSIISGFATHGMAKEASDMFRRMESQGIKANPITFLGVLNGCSHAGLVDEGLEFFRIMVDEYGMTPDIKHYGCLIDMLGRSGRVEEAEVMTKRIPSESSSVVVWRTLLGACCLHGNIKVGERVKNKIIEMEREYGGDYVLMSNIFAEFGRFADSEKMRRTMDAESASKAPGFSIV